VTSFSSIVHGGVVERAGGGGTAGSNGNLARQYASPGQQHVTSPQISASLVGRHHAETRQTPPAYGACYQIV